MAQTARKLARKAAKPSPLRLARTSLGLNGYEVCSALGIDQSYLSLLENGKRKPSLDVAKALAKFYERPMEELFQ